MNYQDEKINNWHFLERHNTVEYIVITHLYVEHGIDYLIFKKCKNKNKILDDNRTYSFAVKLNLCFEMELISETLYKYIKVLNLIRNKLVHNLDVDYITLKNNLTKIVGNTMFLTGEFIKSDNELDLQKYLIMDIGNNTVKPLHNLIKDKYLEKK